MKIYGEGLNKDFEAIKYEPMDLIGKDVKFELWGNFKNQKEVVGLKYLNAASKVSDVAGIGNFKLNLRLSEEEGSARWTREYMGQRLEGKKYEKIFIRGPQEFNWKMEEILLEIGVESSSIIHL